MPGAALGAAALFHLGLEHVPLPAHQLLTHGALVIPQPAPVFVVELLDDLEGPPSVQDVAAHHVGLQRLGDLMLAGVAQLVAGFTEQQIGVAHQLMKRVEVAAGALDVSGMPARELAELIGSLTDQMHAAAAELQFEVAARLRDEPGAREIALGALEFLLRLRDDDVPRVSAAASRAVAALTAG